MRVQSHSVARHCYAPDVTSWSDDEIWPSSMNIVLDTVTDTRLLHVCDEKVTMSNAIRLLSEFYAKGTLKFKSEREKRKTVKTELMAEL